MSEIQPISNTELEIAWRIFKISPSKQTLGYLMNRGFSTKEMTEFLVKLGGRRP